MSSWVDDDFRMDESGVRLVGRRTRKKFSLGDRVTVRLARIDIAARELELALDAPRPGRGGGRPAAGPRRTSPRRSSSAGAKGRGKANGKKRR